MYAWSEVCVKGSERRAIVNIANCLLFGRSPCHGTGFRYVVRWSGWGWRGFVVVEKGGMPGDAGRAREQGWPLAFSGLSVFMVASIMVLRSVVV